MFLQSHPSISDDIGVVIVVDIVSEIKWIYLDCLVEVYLLNLADYVHDDDYAEVDKFVDPNHLLRNIDKTHYRALARSFCIYTLDYACNLMTIYFSAAVSPTGVTYATAVHHVDRKEVFKDGCHRFMFNGHHQRRSLVLVRDDNQLMWPLKLLRI